MHSLFGLPVLTEDELEDKIRMECRLESKPERVELIQNASLILIDEVAMHVLKCSCILTEKEIYILYI
jgi:hypothetical protein